MKKETSALLKKEIPKKFIYYGYLVIVLLAMIVGSLYIVRMNAGSVVNQCLKNGGSWDTQDKKCRY